MTKTFNLPTILGLVLLTLAMVLFPVLPNIAFVNAELWRQGIIIGLAGLLTGLLFLGVALRKPVAIKNSLLTFGLLAWAMSTVAAAIMSPTMLKSLTTSATWLPIALLLLTTLGSTFLSGRDSLARWLVILSGAVFSLVSLIVIIATPFGLAVSTSLNTFVFLGITLCVAVAEIIKNLPFQPGVATSPIAPKKIQLPLPLIGTAVAGILILAAILVMAAGAFGLPVIKSRVVAAQELSLGNSWIVAAESIKTKPLFGSGPGNFTNAYTAARTDPVLLFRSAGNQIFDTLATTGLVGLAGLALFLITLIITGLRSKSSVVKSLSLALAAAAFLTVGNSLILMLVVPLAIALPKGDENSGLKLASHTPVSRLIMATIGILFLVTVYLTGRALAADGYYLQSQSTASLQGIYDSGRSAINMNPYNDAYHRDYAASSLAIAKYLAQNPKLSDQDKTNITSLLQIAVGESELATGQIDPYNYLNWQTKAGVYAALQGLDPQATSSAVAAYNQAIALDPMNPVLRVQFGNLVLASQAYAQAAQLYASAINLKGDYYEAHLDLATALELLNQPLDAVKEYQVVQNSVAKDSADYKTLQTKIDYLEKQASESTIPAVKK